MIDDIYDVNAYSSDEEPRSLKTKALGPITSKNGTKKIFLSRFRLSSRTVERLLEEIEEAISYQTNR
jgi:hypothetical protein